MDSPGSADVAVVQVGIDSERAALGPRVEAGMMAKERSLDSVSNLNDDAVASTTLPQEASIHESQIFVRACNNRTIALKVNLQHDSVEQVKLAIEEREGIPVKEQHLIVGGKPLRQGTFLRDYDALGHQSTVHVSLKIRGGSRTQEKTIGDFLREVYESMHPGGEGGSRTESEGQLPGSKALIDEENPIPGQQDSMPALLNKLGRRILHGVLSCVLSAHEAGLAYDGVCGMDHFRVSVYEGTTNLVRVVCVADGMVSAALLQDLFLTSQEKDYETLKGVIDKLFPVMPLHVQNIHDLLGKLAKHIPSDPEKRTQLLQAHMAMVSSSVGVATMCLNLMRFYDQLPYEENGKARGRGRGRGRGGQGRSASENLPDQHMGKGKAAFENAMMSANTNISLHQAVEKQPLFKNAYEYETNNGKSKTGTSDRVPTNPFIGNTGMEVLSFARNWFTHAPDKRWLGSHRGEAKFKGLPHLDHIFTHHFRNFISEALLQLYINFHDHNLLTEVLVPLA